MTADPTPNNDDWLPDPNPHPGGGTPTPKLTEDDLRASLKGAPKVEEKSHDDQKSSTGKGRAGGKDQGRGSSGSSGKRGGSGRGRPLGEIFDDCPVKALGINGDQHFFLDTKGQLRALDSSFQKNKMLSVFGGQVALLRGKYPQYTGKSKTPKAGDFEALALATAMMQATVERGIWNPVGRMRGPGFWRDEDGGLIFHAGDEVLIDGEWRAPGVHDGKVYPAGDPVPRPSESVSYADAAQKVLKLIQTWAWARPEIDATLALGAICAQMVGGALEWRPVTWLTGDAATGKSTFQRMLKHLHGGDGGLLQAADATEAGVRSVIGYSCLPVALDELEPDDDPRKGKAAAIVKLARIAASGDMILRGSTDQKGYQGNAFSCFLFSSILVPPLPSQDRSRLILLDFNRLGKDAPKPKDDPRRLRTLGSHLRRALIDRWGTWQERLDIWRAELAKRGFGGRMADNYGTVLALSDMALHQNLPPSDAVENWVSKLEPYLTAETQSVGSNAEDMITHLMAQPLEIWRGGRQFNVATWVAMVARLDNARDQINEADPSNGNSYLAEFGLRVKGKGDTARLCIANTPACRLSKLFEGTSWAGGVWSQAAKRMPGATPASMTFARVRTRAYQIPVTSIPGLLNAFEDNPHASDSPLVTDLDDGLDEMV